MIGLLLESFFLATDAFLTASRIKIDGADNLEIEKYVIVFMSTMMFLSMNYVLDNLRSIWYLSVNQFLV